MPTLDIRHHARMGGSDLKDQRALQEAFRAVIDRHDPEEFLSYGAPADEYEAEAEDLATRVSAGQPLTRKMIADVWTHWFGAEDGDALLLERPGALESLYADLAVVCP